jgi:hypothetical protein
MAYDGEATWKSFLVKFTRLARSLQWTDDEQRDHFCLSLDGVANDYYEMTKITISNQSHKSYKKSNQRIGVHGPLNISEVGSGAMEE